MSELRSKISADIDNISLVTDAVSNALGTNDAVLPSSTAPVQFESKRHIEGRRACSKNLGRRKIWDLPPIFHCSLLGLCLSLREMRHLAAKMGITLDVQTTDYNLHHQFVMLAQNSDRSGKRLHRYLDRKYAAAAPEVRKAHCPRELARLWDEGQSDQSNELGALYWVLLLNPFIADDLAEVALNDVHMFSHKAANLIKKAHCDVTQLQISVSELVHQLSREKRQNELLSERNEELSVQVEQHAEREQIEKASGNRIDALEQRVRDLSPAAKLKSELEKIKGILGVSQEDARYWRAQHDAAHRDLNKSNKILYGRKACRTYSPGGERIEQETAVLDLSGAIVAYVGGRGHIVPRLREATEALNGKFVHHDGGVEERVTQLDKCLSNWDILVVPLDSVSHDAASRLKKRFRSLGKTVLWVRTCSVSAFVSALQNNSDGGVVTARHE